MYHVGFSVTHALGKPFLIHDIFIKSNTELKKSRLMQSDRKNH